MPDSRPNVVLIVLDSVRRDHLSCYGYERDTTPHIDRIASQGVRFTRATVASCWTIPSHASLFTGLYPSEHGVDLDTAYGDSDYQTLASILGDSGYVTGSISCNGFITENTNLTTGFQQSLDVLRLRGSGSGIGAKLVRGLHRRWRRLTTRDRGGRRATRLARKWLRDRLNDDQPFFLFMNFMDCHLPYRLRGGSRHRFLAPSERKRADAVPQDPFAVMAQELDFAPQDLQDLQALYDGCLHFLDGQVRGLDEALHELRMADNTLFVVTSDHGESFGEHGLLDHQYGLYESLLAVPLVLRLPDGEGAGTVRDDLIQHVDVLPTVADVVGINGTPAVASGVSALSGAGRDVAFAEYLVPNVKAIRRRFPEADVSRFDVALRWISTDSHKLIARRDGTTELFDLVSDPTEERNIAVAQPALVAELARSMTANLGDWPEARRDGGPVDDMDDMRERLRALGYI